MQNNVSKELMKQALKSQKDEITGAAIYGFMAKRQRRKYPENAQILQEMSGDEFKHYQMWAKITGKRMKAHIFLLKLVTVIMGITFVIKKMQKSEVVGQANYERLQAEFPQAGVMLKEEREHEQKLYGLIDEERLHYVGDMVLGLNDALVELTGAITGVTFSLRDCRLIALTGIITGAAATLSMMASNFLAKKEDGAEHPFKSSIYTGIAYLVTVVLLVLPYLIFMNTGLEFGYIFAFITMILIVIIEIAFFNYYISVAQEKKFFKHFLLMASISLGVAAISFGIGILANKWLGVNV